MEKTQRLQQDYHPELVLEIKLELEPQPEPGPDPEHRRADRDHGRERLGQKFARLRHALRRRTASLRRNVLALCATVPRPHGQTPGGPHRRHPAGDCDRPDESGAQFAQHGRHDDRAQRPPQAAVCPRCHAVLPRLRQARAQGQPRVNLHGTGPARARFRRSEARRHLRGAGACQLYRRGSAGIPRPAGLRAVARRRARRRAIGGACVAPAPCGQGRRPQAPGCLAHAAGRSGPVSLFQHGRVSRHGSARHGPAHGQRHRVHSRAR